VSGLGRVASASRVRIPADVEREDRLLANLTARQLAILGGAGVVLWAGFEVSRRLIPLAVFATVAAPLAAAATVLALGRMGGMSADRLAVAAWRQRRAPRRLVPAPEGVPEAPTFLGIPSPVLPAALRLPFTGIGDDGLVDLGADGLAVVCRASAVTFSLRTPDEQEALVVSFARYLNSLSAAAQIVIRAQPVDLRPAAAELERRAPELPHPGLEQAAREHAAFLTNLAATRDLLRREVLLVLRQGDRDGGGSRLRRQAEEATVNLAAAGVTLVALDREGVAGCLSHAVDPASRFPRKGSRGTEIVTGSIAVERRAGDEDGSRP
jgi:PrgI family protein